MSSTSPQQIPTKKVDKESAGSILLSLFGEWLWIFRIGFLLLPIFWWMYEPKRDARYHRADHQVTHLQPSSFRERARADLFLSIEGFVKLESFKVVTYFMSWERDLLIQMKGYTRRLVLHVMEGPLYDDLIALTDAKQSSLKQKLQAMIQKRRYRVSGRLYKSNGVRGFSPYNHMDDIEIHLYIRQHLKGNIGYRNSPTNWLLAVGEIPSKEGYWDSHLGLFWFISILGGLSWLLWLWQRYKKPNEA